MENFLNLVGKARSFFQGLIFKAKNQETGLCTDQMAA